MTDFSKFGNLSREYSNHSIIVGGEISWRHILKVSGHKSEISLKWYSHFVSDEKY